ncbi:MAG: hypothetical protein U0326_20290 [Polyangiales bacterium]
MMHDAPASPPPREREPRHPQSATVLLTRFAVALLAILASCSELKSAGEQCAFNDDCVDPLVCAANRCRAQCRTGRDCAPGTVCIPSESPFKQVCVPARESSICGGDSQCPLGSVCLDRACWWVCRESSLCASRVAGACQVPPGLCAIPVTAQVQSDMPRLIEVMTPADAATDAPAADVDTPDAPPVDVATDAPATDTPVTDAPALDAPAADAAFDAPSLDVSDVATLDRPTMDAPLDGAADAPRADVADVPREPGPLPCVDGADCVLPNATGRCASGACVVASCTSGYTDCNGQPSDGCEVRTGNDVSNCGACGARCPTPAHTTVACASGMCVPTACEAGFGDCDGDPANGCEADLATDALHCGGCGQTCTRLNVTGAACLAGRCVITRCATGWGDCDRTGVLSDPRAPTAEFSNGCESATDSDALNCGACGVACNEVSGRCVRGACASDRVLGWVASPTSSTRELALAATPGMATTVVTIASGVYNLDRFVVPAGVELRASGAGVLDLRVLGEARIEGVVNLSGGHGGSSAPLADASGHLGGGGGTGTTLDGAPASAPSCTATGGGGGTGGEPGGWAPGARSCGGPGNLGGGAGGAPGLGGSGGGGRSAGSGGASGSMDGGEGAGNIPGGGVGASTGGGSGGDVMIGGAPNGAGYGGSNASGARTCGAASGGGGSIGSLAALDRLARTEFVSGSGGGGGGGLTVSAGAGGGGGGGVFRLSSATRIVLSGSVLAQGGNGGSVASDASTAGGAGGGGSGGLIVLVAPNITISPGATVAARGGVGGRVTVAGVPCGSVGGSGGAGRVVLQTQCSTFTRQGSFDPPLSACVAQSSIGPLMTSTQPRALAVDYP